MTLEADLEPPAPDGVAYRRALGAFATGVCVVTADGAAGPVGITVNSFASVSLEPRLVLWSLDERSVRWPAFSAAERFAVHVLSARDRDRAARFSRGAGRLDPSEFTRPDDGPPALPDVLARFDCAVHQRIPMGDHLILVGRVLAFEASAGGDALTFYRGRYGAASHLIDREQS